MCLNYKTPFTNPTYQIPHQLVNVVPVSLYVNCQLLCHKAKKKSIKYATLYDTSVAYRQ